MGWPVVSGDREVIYAGFRGREYRSMFIGTDDPKTVMVSVGFDCDSIYGTAADVATLFASFPPEARVAGSSYEWPHIEVLWGQPPTADDLIRHRAERAAAAHEEADRAEFEAWRAANREVVS